MKGIEVVTRRRAARPAGGVDAVAGGGSVAGGVRLRRAASALILRQPTAALH